MYYSWVFSGFFTYFSVKCNALMTSLPVLNQPIVFAAVCAVSYSQHSVIQSGLATEKLVVDPGLVELEAHVTGVNSNGDGADGSNGALKICFTLALDICESGICGSYVGGIEATFTVL